jgi:YidC/Oxa1 family membrane protein insertase
MNDFKPGGDMHPQDKKNFITFIVLASLVYFSFDYFVFKPHAAALKAQRQARQIEALKEAEALPPPEPERPRQDVLRAVPRLVIDNPQVFGTLALQGLRIDDLSLRNFFLKRDHKDPVSVLNPVGVKGMSRYAEFGWIPAGPDLRVPDKESRWMPADPSATLRPGFPVRMTWNSGQGLTFEREIAIDDHFVMTVTQRVRNASAKPVTLYPYALVSEHGMPEHFGGRTRVVHEGPIGYIGGELVEKPFRKMADDPLEPHSATTGWIGITEKYWMAALIPDQKEDMTYRFLYTKAARTEDKDRYQVDMTGQARTLAPGQSAESTVHLFAGAKVVKTIAGYETSLGVNHFDLTVDFGLFYFLTKPFFYLLDFLYGLAGNFGVAIILFTLLLRIAIFPLANLQYRSFAGLKKIAPEMATLRETYKNDREKLQKALMELYTREKVNPMAGCLPILVQIPVFFSLYKVLSITIEMRHAPFFGWIKDLSEPDPTSVFNLFGLIDWTPPQQLMIGAWPCLMLVAMILQKSMNPPPQDPIQAKMFAFLPWFMTYIMAQFASGLVVYWTVGNILSMIQQYVIMRSMGVEVHFFRHPKEEKEMEKQVAEGPVVHPELALIEEKVEQALFGPEDSRQGSVRDEHGKLKKKKKKPT